MWERLGWWSPVSTERIDYAIDRKAWENCVSDEEKPEGKTAYGVKFAADGSFVCLCGAVSAAGLLINTINEGGLTWYRPQQILNESAITATKRSIAGGFGFGGDNSLPIEACALALWGAKTSRRDPNRKMRIG